MALKLSHFRVLLLAGASAVAVSTAAHAAPRVLFAAGSGVAQGAIPPGQPVTAQGGVTQVQLDSGAVVSFVGPAVFSVDAGGNLQVQSGNLTLGPGTGPTVIGLPNGGSLNAAAGTSAAFNVQAGGAVTGQVMTGSATVATAGGSQTFSNAQFFQAAPGGAPSQTFAGLAPQATPGVGGGGGVNIGGYNPVLNAAIQQNPALTTFPLGQSPSQIASYLVALGQTIGQLYTPAQLIQLAQQYGPQTPTPTPTTPTPTPTTPTPTPTTPTPTPTTPTPTPTTPTPTPTNSAGLVNGQTYPAGAVGRNVDNQAVGTGDAGSIELGVDASGNPNRFGTNTVTTATLAQVNSAAGWTVGRYSNGNVERNNGATTGVFTFNANNGMSFFALTPVTGALPTTGVAIYDTLSATTPILYDGNTAPGGSFTAKLGIDLGTARKIGFEGVLTLPQGASTAAYNFTTAGGAAAPSAGLTYGTGLSLNFEGRAPVTTTGSLCGTAGCELFMRGSVGGADGVFAGAIYEMRDTASTRYPAGGAVVFSRTSVNTPTPTPTTPTPTPTTPTPTPIATVGAYNGVLSLLFDQAGPNDFDGRVYVERAAATFNTDGGLESVAIAGGGVSRGTAKLTDVGGDAVVTVGRWRDGAFTDRTTNPISGSSNTGVLPLNGGVHYALGVPSGPLPVAGSATYDLLAATRPTMSDGSLSPGLFDGKMAVAFGYAPRLGLEGSVTMTESGAPVVYSFTTPGGIAGTAAGGYQIQSAGNAFGFIPVTGTGAACASACRFNFTAGFAGTAFDHAMLNYSIGSISNPGVFLQGAAAFRSASGPTGLSTAEASPTNSGSALAFSGPANVAVALPGGRNLQQDLGFTGQTSQLTTGADNAITRMTLVGTDFQRGTAGTADLAGTSDWQIGRWNGGRMAIDGLAERDVLLGAAQGGFGYAAIKPTTGALPTAGTAQYTLVGATRPVYSNESTAPGTFTANMAVAFAATPKIGIDGVITMPDATYAFASTGGSANPAQSNISSFTNAGQRSFSLYGQTTLTGTSQICAVATGCMISLNGVFGGAAGEYSAVSYIVSDFDNYRRPSLGGAAVFRSGPLTGGPDPVTGTERTGQVVVFSGDTVGVDTRSATTTADADGRINKYVNIQNPSAEAPERGSNTGNDVGKAGTGDVIIWTRWSGGTTGGNYFGNQPTTRNANQGLHIISGTRATNLPTVGSATYALAGYTKPTHGGGTIAPGTFTGSLGVAFGSQAKVGFDLRPTIDGQTYILATTGGATTPASSQISLNTTNMTFSSASGNDINVAAGGICPSGCLAFVQGFLAGDGGTYAGVGYNFGPGGNGGAANRIYGSAVFNRTAYDPTPAVNPNAKPPVSSGSISGPLRVLTTTNAMSGTMLMAPTAGTASEANVTSAVITNADGLLTGFTSNSNGSGVWSRNDAVTAELAGTRYLQIGRWNGGTILKDGAAAITPDGWRGGVYLVGSPMNSFSLPQSITATYALQGSSSVFTTGQYGPGVLQGTAAVAFGTGGSWKMGLSANLTTTEANGQVVYNLSTTGGAADPSQSQINGSIASYSNTSPTGSSVCTAALCTVNIRNVLLAGPEARDAGLSFRIGTSSSNSIVGAAFFQRNDKPILMRQEVGMVGASMTPGTLIITNGVGQANHYDATVTYAANGAIESVSSGNGYAGLGTATAVTGSAGGLSWARWSNGTVQTNANGNMATLSANQSMHTIIGDPASNIPTTGTATFALAGSTAPTITNGSVAPGTFAGSMAVQFNSNFNNTRVGFDFDVSIGGHTYDLVSAGGLTDLSQSQYRLNNGQFGSVANQSVNLTVNAGGPACGGSSCTASVGGFLTGPGVTGAGVVYSIGQPNSPNQPTTVQGAAAFTRN